MLYIKLFIEREKNIGQSAPECPFKQEGGGQTGESGISILLLIYYTAIYIQE